METKKKIVRMVACVGLGILALTAACSDQGRSGASKETAAAKPAAAEKTAAQSKTPGTGSLISAFSDRPFTADITIRGKLAAYHGRMYTGRNAMRTDVDMGHGVTASVIVRYDKGIAWILMSNRHYIQSPIHQHSDLLSALRDPNAKVQKRDLGPGKVGAYPCEKYQVQVTSGGHKQSGWIWVAKEKRLDGFIVKAQDAGSKETVTLSKIRFGAPPASVFEVPAGYHKLTSPPKSAKKSH